MPEGHCEHGKFDLSQGCPQCTADRMAKEGNTAANVAEAVKANQRQLVKVKYCSQTTGEISDREYTYYSVDRLNVGDIVQVPVRDNTRTAVVSGIDVDPAEIAAFADKVKTIPSGSLLPPEPTTALPSGGLAEAAQAAGAEVTVAKVSYELELVPTIAEIPIAQVDTKINLCDTCMNRLDLPNCMPVPGDIEFGDGLGNDNISKCVGYKPETAVALRPGEDMEARDHHAEGLKALAFAEARVIATLEDNQKASDDLVLIGKLRKQMDTKRKVKLEPLKVEAAAIRATYDYLMTPILDAENITKGKMLAYDKEQRRVRAEQEDINRKRMEAAQAEMKLTGELSEPVSMVEVSSLPTKSTRSALGVSSVTDCWKYKIINLDLVPDAYKIIDHAMLNTIAKKHQDKKPVAGVEFYNEPGITARGK